jgi:hypothetical protein
MGKLNLIEVIPLLSTLIELLRKNLADLDPSFAKPKNKRRGDLHQFQKMVDNEGHALSINQTCKLLDEDQTTSNSILNCCNLKQGVQGVHKMCEIQDFFHKQNPRPKTVFLQEQHMSLEDYLHKLK